MIIKQNFKQELIDTMSEQHINILIDFANNFINTFGNRMTKEELLKRINKLNYIGFEGDIQTISKCGSANAIFSSAENIILISKKHKGSSDNIIKSLLYHELIHCISHHSEKNLDAINNNCYLARTGLNRSGLEFDSKYDGPGFDEGDILEDIMTEYYATIMLKKEGIDFNGTYTLNKYNLSEDYVEYHGTGYMEIAALGEIYDFIFGDEIFKAKFYDGNDFRKKFNATFKNTNIFDDDFNDLEYEVPAYSKFVAQRGPMERYKTACHIFVHLFKEKYKNSINEVKDLLNNKNFELFLSMLVKTRNKFDNSTKINRELYMLTKELSKNLVNELFGNKIKDNKYGVDTEDIESVLFLTIEKIYTENNTIDLNDVKYAVFYDDNFKGIFLTIGNQKYIIDYKTLGQNINYAKLKQFSNSGFSKDDIEMYSKDYKMDISNAEYASINNPASIVTFILKDEKLYNHNGEEIIIGNFNNYTTSKNDNKLHSR